MLHRLMLISIILSCLFICAVIFICNFICAKSENKSANMSMKYPYIASEERQEQILNNCNLITRNMNKFQVGKVRGEPDEVNKTYNSRKGGEIIGELYVYIISRDTDVGSVNEKNERLIGIHFNTNNQLTYAYGDNVPEFKDIEKE